MGFKVELLPERIILFDFFDFKRETVDKWAEHVKAQDGKMLAPLRVMYNFRGAGYPTPYLLKVSVVMMETLQIPEDTRTAYMVQDRSHVAFGMVVARKMPRRAGLVRVFINQDEAKAWLLSNPATKSTASPASSSPQS